jgi:hypothetical protein
MVPGVGLSRTALQDSQPPLFALEKQKDDAIRIYLKGGLTLLKLSIKKRYLIGAVIGFRQLKTNSGYTFIIRFAMTITQIPAA